jgi:hypothetical protein
LHLQFMLKSGYLQDPSTFYVEYLSGRCPDQGNKPALVRKSASEPLQNVLVISTAPTYTTLDPVAT